MRKVFFKKFIQSEYEDVNGGKKLIEGTGCWQKDFINEGIFHQWGSKYEEYETNAGNYTVALIECADGTIEEVLPSNLKFYSVEEMFPGTLDQLNNI